MKIRIHTIVLFSFCLVFSASCASKIGIYRAYGEKEKHSYDTTATLVIPNEMYKLKTVDGKSVTVEGSKYTVVKLLPGEHVIRFDFHQRIIRKWGSFKIEQYYEYLYDRDYERDNKIFQYYNQKNKIILQAKAGYLYTIASFYNLKSKFRVQIKIVEFGPYRVKYPDRMEIYCDADNGEMVVKRKGSEKRWDLEIYTLNYSPDKKRVTFINSTPRHNFDKFGVYGWPVIDGVESEYHATSLINFSSDGKRYAFVALMGFFGDGMLVVDNGKPGKEYHRIWSTTPYYNRHIPYIVRDKNHELDFDSKNRIIYVARDKDGKYLIVIDGKESRKYDLIYDVIYYSPQRMAFRAVKKFKDEVKQCCVVNNVEGKWYDRVVGLELDKQSREYYIANEDKWWYLIVDGKEVNKTEKSGDIIEQYQKFRKAKK